MDPEHVTLARIDQLSQGEPQAEFTDGEGVTHRLWVVSDPETVAAVCGDFKDRKLYIADGHHRYETALNFRNYCREQGLAKEGDPADYICLLYTSGLREGTPVSGGMFDIDACAVAMDVTDEDVYKRQANAVIGFQSLDTLSVYAGRKTFVNGILL